MNDTTKAAIAQLPSDAPAPAVIAAWAGKQVSQSSGGGRWYCGHMQYVPAPREAQGERTLRRWLLDNKAIVHYFPRRGNRYGMAINWLNVRDQGYSGRGESPEAAFLQAVEVFAKSLKEEAK